MSKKTTIMTSAKRNNRFAIVVAVVAFSALLAFTLAGCGSGSQGSSDKKNESCYVLQKSESHYIGRDASGAKKEMTNTIEYTLDNRGAITASKQTNEGVTMESTYELDKSGLPLKSTTKVEGSAATSAGGTTEYEYVNIGENGLFKSRKVTNKSAEGLTSVSNTAYVWYDNGMIKAADTTSEGGFIKSGANKTEYNEEGYPTSAYIDQEGSNGKFTSTTTYEYTKGKNGAIESINLTTKGTSSYGETNQASTILCETDENGNIVKMTYDDNTGSYVTLTWKKIDNPYGFVKAVSRTGIL